ncbi:phage tail tape measure protein [Escherichia coli]|nr:phage tail tape measure protein [Escherichia coli]
MSDRKLNLTVNLGAKNKLSGPLEAARRQAARFAEGVSAARKNIRDLERQTKKYARENENVRKSLAAYETAKARVAQLKEAHRTLAQVSGEEKRELELARKARERAALALNDSRKAAEKAAEALKAHNVALKRDERDTGTLDAAARRYTQTLKAQERELERVTALQRSYHRAKNLKDRMASAGMRMTMGGMAGGYAQGRLLSEGVDFNFEMSKVQALTRLDKHDPELAALRGQARELGAKTQYTSVEAAQGQGYLAMAGYSPEKIRAAMPGVLNAAASMDVDISFAADSISNIQTSLGMSADEADRVGDVLTRTITSANVNFQEMAESMKYAGAYAHMMGMDVEETVAMTGIMGDAGIKGSMAGTAMKGLNRLSTHAGAREALKALEVDLTDAHGRIRPMVDVMEDIGRNIQRFDQVSQLALQKELWGQYATAGLSVVVRKAASGELRARTEANRNSQGDAERNARIRNDNLKGDIRQLNSAFSDLRIELSERLDPVFRSVTQTLTDLTRQAGEWMKAHPDAVRMIGLTAAGLTIAAVAAGALAMGLATVLVPMAALRLSIGVLTGGRGGLLFLPGILKNIGGRILSLVPGFSRLTGSMKKTAGTAEAVSAGLSGTGRSGRGAMMQVRGWAVLWQYATGRVKRATGALKSAGAAIRGLGLRGLSQALAGALRTSLLNAFSGAAVRAVTMVGTVLRVVAIGLGFLLTPVGALVAALVTAAFMIWKYWAPVKAFFVGFFTAIREKLAPLHERFVRVFGGLAPLLDMVVDGLKKVITWFGHLLEPARTSGAELEKCTEAGRKFGEVVGDAVAWVAGKVLSLVEGLEWLLAKLELIPGEAEKATAAVKEVKSGGAEDKKTEVPPDGKAANDRAEDNRPALPPTGKLSNGTAADNKASLPGTESDGKPAPPAGDDWKFGTKTYSVDEDSTSGSTVKTPEDIQKLGDIVFRNRPPVRVVNGGWQEPRVNVPRSSLRERLSSLWQDTGNRLKSWVPVAPVMTPAVADGLTPYTGASSRPSPSTVDSHDQYHFELHFHGVDMRDAGRLGEMVKNKLRELLRENDVRQRSRLCDRE